MFYTKLLTATAMGMVRTSNTIISWSSQPPQPSASKTPRENLEILLQSAKAEHKEVSERWFTYSKTRDEAKVKVDAYSKMLKELGND